MSGQGQSEWVWERKLTPTLAAKEYFRPAFAAKNDNPDRKGYKANLKMFFSQDTPIGVDQISWKTAFTDLPKKARTGFRAFVTHFNNWKVKREAKPEDFTVVLHSKGWASQDPNDVAHLPGGLQEMFLQKMYKAMKNTNAEAATSFTQLSAVALREAVGFPSRFDYPASLGAP
ncbi:hypothetical protein JCM16303_002131 [Sporobolomyces ruberrimus]